MSTLTAIYSRVCGQIVEPCRVSVEVGIVGNQFDLCFSGTELSFRELKKLKDCILLQEVVKSLGRRLLWYRKLGRELNNDRFAGLMKWSLAENARTVLKLSDLEHCVKELHAQARCGCAGRITRPSATPSRRRR